MFPHRNAGQNHEIKKAIESFENETKTRHMKKVTKKLRAH